MPVRSHLLFIVGEKVSAYADVQTKQMKGNIMRSCPLADPIRAGLAVFFIAVLSVSGCSSDSDASSNSQDASSNSQKEPALVEIPVRVAEPGVITVSRTFAGRTSGAREVEVPSRVSGVLQRRSYGEGDVVDKGDVLFEIDPLRYEVRVQHAEAELQRAEAVERQARREWNLVSSRFEDDASSQRERDEALSELELAKTGLSRAEAVLAETRIDLNYTNVIAPLGGTAGLSEYAEGSLVNAGDLLVTVTQLDPIQVRFSIPEAQMNAFASQIRAGSPLKVLMTLPDDSQYPEAGSLDFTGSGVDPSTGTVLVRAVFPNKSQTVLPGQFVRLTLSGLNIGRMIQVPEEAVAEDDDGPLVYVLDDEDRPQPKAVKLGQRMPGGEIVVTEGISSGDRVVVVSIHGLDKGMAVKPRVQESPVSKSDSTASEGNR
jgi:membrane fusion protein (multidrug efflux system)